MKAAPEPDGKLRLAQQSRTAEGNRYFFMCRGVMLTVYISPRSTPEDPSDWRVEVRAGTAPDEAIVQAWAPTRMQAVAEAGQSWATLPVSALPAIDWALIVEALQEVRALSDGDDS